MEQTWKIGLGVVLCVVFGAWVAWPPPKPKKPKPEPKVTAPVPVPVAGRVHDRLVPADRPAPPAEAPNVVLIFGCTVRKDQTSLYSDLATTPWLADLAAAGTRFDDALSVSSWTRASATGVLTAQHPLTLNLPEPDPKQSQRILPPEATTLAEHLSSAGWLTVGTTANPNLNHIYGMAQGMDRYRDSHPKAFRKGRKGGYQTVDEIVEVLDGRTEAEKERPFYLQLMLIDAHHPRRPTPVDIARFEQDEDNRTLVRYRASLAQLDRAMKHLDTQLQTRGYTPENTLFVFVTDHGEGLETPEHHGSGHGKKMYPTSVEIPWVMRGPGVAADGRIEGLASGLDVTPTVLGLLGLDPPSTGMNHAALVQAGKGRTSREHAFAASMFHVADVASIWTSDKQCQHHYGGDRDKRVTGCFDRKADPEFRYAVKNEGLRAELEKTRAALLEQGKDVAVRRANVDAEVAEQLKLLGYAED